jgi:hypothetical protein
MTIQDIITMLEGAEERAEIASVTDLGEISQHYVRGYLRSTIKIAVNDLRFLALSEEA